MTIASLVTSALPGVERAAAEFGHAHGIDLTGAVPLASVSRDDTAQFEGLTPVHALKPKQAWDRNLSTASGALILCPPRFHSLTVEYLVQACKQFAIPHFLTPGLRVAETLEWLDSEMLDGKAYHLMVSGPTEEESSRLGPRTYRLLDSVFTA